MKPIYWSIKDIVHILKERQNNEFDGRMAICGDTGNGKSTLILKILLRFKDFNNWKHQVYSRDDLLRLLKTEKRGFAWDDEAINSGYKRNFNQAGQQDLIKTLTAYRDSFNIFASTIPNFFSLDKDLRDLYFIMIQIIERGVGVVHMPLQGRLYSQDKWDAKNNAKIEESWSRRQLKDPNFKPRYHTLSTFRGYIFFSDATPKQKKLYLEVKRTKRQGAFMTEAEKLENQELPFIDKFYSQLLEGKLTQDGIYQICLMEKQKYSSVVSNLNRKLKDDGKDGTVKSFLKKIDKIPFHSNHKDEIDKLVPSF